MVGDEHRVSSFNLGVLRLLLFSQQLFMESLQRAGSHYRTWEPAVKKNMKTFIESVFLLAALFYAQPC